LASLLLGISIALTRHRHRSPSISSSLVIQYYTPRHRHPLLSSYRHPALSTPPSLVSVSLTLRRRRYQASVSFSCLRTPSPSSASASPSTGFVSLLPLYNQYQRYSYTPTNLLIETHKHSLQSRALFSYTPRLWMHNPYNGQLADYQGTEGAPLQLGPLGQTPRKRKASTAFPGSSRGQNNLLETLDSPSAQQPLRQLQSRPKKHHKIFISDSEADEMQSIHSKPAPKPQAAKPPPSVVSSGEELEIPMINSKASAFPISCQCGFIGDGNTELEVQDYIQCEVCKDWSHIACQCDGRASACSRKSCFVCDSCEMVQIRIDLRPWSVQSVITVNRDVW
jgi:hypothetical protein